jgi:Probable zinc-ribbon domain
MSSTRHSDLLLRCSCCGDSFVYSAGEQELHAVRGVKREPNACPACRKLLGHGLNA